MKTYKRRDRAILNCKNIHKTGPILAETYPVSQILKQIKLNLEKKTNG